MTMIMGKDKLKALIAAILSKAGKIPKVKLAKLILFSEIEHFKKTGTSITEMYFIRLPYGPVIAFFDEVLEEGLNTFWNKETSFVPIYESGRQRKQYSYFSTEKLPVYLDDNMQETVNCVISNYGKKTGTELSNLSHRLPAWKYSEPNEPIYISELAVDDEEKYFAMIDLVEELDSEEDDFLEEELLRILPNA